MFKRTRAFLRHLTGHRSDYEEEKRGYGRLPANLETIARKVNSEEEFVVRLQNISRSGVGFVSAAHFSPGAMLRIELPGAPNLPHPTLLACVIHSKLLEDGNHYIGCMFSMDLTDDEMKIFGGEKRASTASSDQRAWVRYPAQGEIEYSLVPDDGQRRQAALVDISPTGAGLIFPNEMQAGSVITIYFQKDNDPKEIACLACIVYMVHHAPQSWAGGCNFMRELSDFEISHISVS
ncbi:MAG: PilZ domain-containing protein [Zavarzinella sp.]